MSISDSLKYQRVSMRCCCNIFYCWFISPLFVFLPFFNFILGCWFVGYPAPVTTSIFLDDDIIIMTPDEFYRLHLK